MSLRSFNHRDDQTAGSVVVTEIPDLKNIVNVPGHGEMVREKAKMLPETDLVTIAQNLPADTIAKITERLTFQYQNAADSKTQVLIEKGTKPLQNALANAQQSGNDYMIGAIQEKIANFKVDPVVPQSISEVDIARVYIDSLITARPVANFFGGDILEPVFNWLYSRLIGTLTILEINLRQVYTLL